MTKFANTQTARRSPVSTAGPAVTHEGGAAFSRDAKGDLFVLALANLVGEDTFYESAATRDARYRSLVRQVAAEDPAWLVRFIGWLRTEGFMRSAPLVAAAEAAAVRMPGARAAIDAACQRADEPSELLGYWLATYGRPIPSVVKRGLGDAARRLFTQRNAIRWDGSDRGVRMADVVELCRPEPADSDGLAMVQACTWLDALPIEERRVAMLDSDHLRAAGFYWERLSGWLQGPMDAAAWEAAIPLMGYMALLRNLRNFSEAGISPVFREVVARRIADPDDVARSMQFPFRFYSAWKAASDLTWALPLELALEASCDNVPDLAGRTLVLVDVSASMGASLSSRSSVARYEVGAVFGATLARKGGADLVAFGTTSSTVPIAHSVLRTADRLSEVFNSGRLGHGTNGHGALARHWQGHDRVVIFTDDQMHDSGRVLPKTRIYTFNLGGYAPSALPSGTGDSHTFAGFSDRCFALLRQLEDRGRGGWPF